MTNNTDSEFTGKTFRECAEIIVGNPKDKAWTDMLITELVKQHELRLTAQKQRLLEALPEKQKAYPDYAIDRENGYNRAIDQCRAIVEGEV